MSEAAKARKRKRLSSEERREAFLQKAIEFFADEGFASSTRELAKRLDVTQPLLYRYFASKEALISEVYEAVYVRRWRAEWDEMLADRSLPLRDRLIRFYHAYTEVVFQRDWMRIFLFAGLKGGAINRRYIDRVSTRILLPIVREYRDERALPEAQVSDSEIELAWSVHGGIYYHGVRTEIYGQDPPMGLDFVIESSVDSLIAALDRFHDQADVPRAG